MGKQTKVTATVVPPAVPLQVHMALKLSEWRALPCFNPKVLIVGFATTIDQWKLIDDMETMTVHHEWRALATHSLLPEFDKASGADRNAWKLWAEGAALSTDLCIIHPNMDLTMGLLIGGRVAAIGGLICLFGEPTTSTLELFNVLSLRSLADYQAFIDTVERNKHIAGVSNRLRYAKSLFRRY